MMQVAQSKERLDQLRRRLAAAESASVIKRVQADVNAFAEGAAADVLLDLADLQDRCAGKAERLGGAPAPKQSRKLQLLQRRSVQQVPDGKTPGTTIRMQISEWVTDQQGIRSRVLWRSDDGPMPP